MDARQHVARRDPAVNFLRLKFGTDGIRRLLIFRGVADEDLMRHGKNFLLL
jgi:hypothetical protein